MPHQWPKTSPVLPRFNYLRGGLLPRPPPDGLPVSLGPFFSVVNIVFPCVPEFWVSRASPGHRPRNSETCRGLVGGVRQTQEFQRVFTVHVIVLFKHTLFKKTGDLGNTAIPPRGRLIDTGRSFLNEINAVRDAAS